jgi:VanZ family protein
VRGLGIGGVAEAPKRIVIVAIWLALLVSVVVGSLLPADSVVMRAVSQLPVSDKALHFAAYLALAALPVMGFRERRCGLTVGLAMFGLGLVLEGLQHFVAGRAVELRDIVANGVGVGCGALLGVPLRACLSLL